MESIDTSRCLAHILVCKNRRPNAQIPCCAEADAQRVYDAFRDWLEQRRLLTRIWLTGTECMGWCHDDGATVAIYPDEFWYRAVTPGDCSVLIERHLAHLVDPSTTKEG